jgi:protein TonB
MSGGLLKGLFALAALLLAVIPVSAQVRLPVAGQDVPVPRLLATPDPYRVKPASTPLGWNEMRRGGSEDEERFDRGILIMEFVVRADGRTENVKSLIPSRTLDYSRISTRVYEPVVVNGKAHPVLMVEFNQRVFSEDELFKGLTSIARNQRLPAHVRRVAIADLPSLSSSPVRTEAVATVLTSLKADPDEAVRRAADDAANDRRHPLSAGIDVPAPRRIGFAVPGYPAMAWHGGMQGVVPLSIILGPSGRPTSVVPLLKVPVLDEAALEAVYQWRYDPTVINGQPVSVRFTEYVPFFRDERSKYQWSSRTAKDTDAPQVARLAAIDSLSKIATTRRDGVRNVLERLIADEDGVVAAEARRQLERLQGDDAPRRN